MLGYGQMLTQLVQEHRYMSLEVFDLLKNSGWLNAKDLELHKGLTETKAYRRTQNALRDASAKGLLERNKFSSTTYQYRIPKEIR